MGRPRPRPYKYLLGDNATESARLRAQARLWDPTALALFDRLRIRRGWRILEIGPGNGSLHCELRRRAGGPVDAVEPVPILVGGQRISPGLPWYRGRPGAPMEPESSALCDVVRRELLGRPFSLAVDCHSGFGMRDRLWFPYAHRRTPIAHLAQLHALHEIFRQTHAYHPYVFEPQSHQYLAHGDLWDHLYRLAGETTSTVFLPLTLEMGSWLWVKKNPRQLFSVSGMFNPLIEHREHRVLRRHVPLLEFLIHAAAGHRRWLPEGETLTWHRRQALARWYGGVA